MRNHFQGGSTSHNDTCTAGSSTSDHVEDSSILWSVQQHLNDKTSFPKQDYRPPPQDVYAHLEYGKRTENLMGPSTTHKSQLSRVLLEASARYHIDQKAKRQPTVSQTSTTPAKTVNSPASNGTTEPTKEFFTVFKDLREGPDKGDTRPVASTLASGLKGEFVVIRLPSWSKIRQQGKLPFVVVSMANITDDRTASRATEKIAEEPPPPESKNAREWIPKLHNLEENMRRSITGLISSGGKGPESFHSVSTIPSIAKTKKTAWLEAHLSQEDHLYIDAAIQSLFVPPGEPIYIVELEGYGVNYIKEWCLSRTLLLEECSRTQKEPELFSYSQKLPLGFKSVLKDLPIRNNELLRELDDAEVNSAIRTLLAADCYDLSRDYKDEVTRTLYRCPSLSAEWLLAELLSGKNSSSSAHIASIRRVHTLQYLDKEVRALLGLLHNWRQGQLPSASRAKRGEAHLLKPAIIVSLRKVHAHCAFQVILREGYSRCWDILCNDTALWYIEGNEKGGSRQLPYGAKQIFRSELVPHSNARLRGAPATSNGVLTTTPTLFYSQELPIAKATYDSETTHLVSAFHGATAIAYNSPSILESKAEITRLSKETKRYLQATSTKDANTEINTSTGSSEVLGLCTPLPSSPCNSAEETDQKQDPSKDLLTSTESTAEEQPNPPGSEMPFIWKLMKNSHPSRSTFESIADLAAGWRANRHFRILPDLRRNRYGDGDFKFWFELSGAWFEYDAAVKILRINTTTPIDTYKRIYQEQLLIRDSDATIDRQLELADIREMLCQESLNGSGNLVITTATRAKLLLKQMARMSKYLSKAMRNTISEDCHLARKMSLSVVVTYQADPRQRWAPRPTSIQTSKQDMQNWYLSRLLCAKELSDTDLNHQSRRSALIDNSVSFLTETFHNPPTMNLEYAMKHGSARWVSIVRQEQPTNSYILALLRYLRSSELVSYAWLFEELIVGKRSKDSVHISCVLGAHAAHMSASIKRLDGIVKKWGEDLKAGDMVARMVVDDAIKEILEECAFWSVLKKGLGDDIIAKAIEGYVF
ncbi:hypothetical protein BJ508DRAFT_363101 [Ascobolus immersus RN42]|uniref:Uncharacterized protein n=1 Tax=Ascobolus immersus RN42 TaxID=1160509 RepID=A0A3N4I2G3_ASCIM|nr:hypothetical protein BJ508DRAFT_363101 [Ascobolus immersus RN42]